MNEASRCELDVGAVAGAVGKARAGWNGFGDLRGSCTPQHASPQEARRQRARQGLIAHSQIPMLEPHSLAQPPEPQDPAAPR